MSSPDEQSSYMEPSSPIGRTHLGLAALFVTPSQKITDGKADRAVDDEQQEKDMYVREENFLYTRRKFGFNKKIRTKLTFPSQQQK